MIRRAAVAACLVLLSGCGGLSTFVPYVQDVTDPAVLVSDTAACRAHALDYETPLDLEVIGTASLKGAAGNAAGGAVNPLVPVLGGLGGASVALLDSLNVLSENQQRVFLICLHDRGERSRAYDVMDPRQ